MRAFEASLIGAGLLVVAAATWAGASTYPVPPSGGGSGGGGGGISQTDADARYLQQTGGTVSGDQAVTGNLTLSGYTSKLVLSGAADGTDIVSGSSDPIKIDLRSNTSELQVLGGKGIGLDCTGQTECAHNIYPDSIGRGLYVWESTSQQHLWALNKRTDGDGFYMHAQTRAGTGLPLYFDPTGLVGSKFVVGSDVSSAGEKFQVVGTSGGVIRAQYNNGGTTPPAGLHLVNTTESATQYPPTLLYEGSNGRCHRMVQQGIDLVIQGKNAPCDSGVWYSIAYFSTYGITMASAYTFYMDGPIVNDGAANGGAVFVNDDLLVAGRMNYGTAKTSAPSCAADADVGVVTKYSKPGGATISLCVCTKLGGAYTLTPLGTGDCT